MEDLNDITYKIRRAIFNVHNELGPGLFESVYEAALLIELEEQGLQAVSQVPINATYKGKDLGLGFKLDILVEDKIIIELKAIESLTDTNKKQLLTYLKMTNKSLGILVNFNAYSIVDKESIFRIINSA